MAKSQSKECKYTRLTKDQMTFVLRQCIKHDLSESDVISRCVEAARKKKSPDFKRELPAYLKGVVPPGFKNKGRIEGYRAKLKKLLGK